MIRQQILPAFVIGKKEELKDTIHVILPKESKDISSLNYQSDFQKNGFVKIGSEIWINTKKYSKYSIQNDVNITFSEQFQKTSNYYGVASGILASAYQYSLKEKKSPQITVYLDYSTRDAQKIINSANALIKSRSLANGRGDIYSSPEYFVQKAKDLTKKYNLNLKILRRKQLDQQGFTLFHAVSRGSNKDPAMINISYQGNPDSKDWIAFIGKGLCFDSGGLDLKSASGLTPMFLDKSGACSCFAAFEQIVKENLSINLTVTMGMVQNFIGKNSYRPSDIIKSKKGYTIEIADTDAEGRLVLADCMTWTQQNYKVSKMIELSTLTYSCITALGHDRAGIFGNQESFNLLLKQIGSQVQELGWILPFDEGHFQQLLATSADFLSDANDGVPGASIAAAFLQKFVEEGVSWIHLDVAGTCINLNENKGTGYGARLLLQLARRLCQSK